jgi:ABC-type branched-subunit amino acid transport system ATPase component
MLVDLRSWLDEDTTTGIVDANGSGEGTLVRLIIGNFTSDQATAVRRSRHPVQVAPILLLNVRRGADDESMIVRRASRDEHDGMK